MIRSQSLNQLEKSTFQETTITGFLKTDDSKKLIKITEQETRTEQEIEQIIS